MLDTCALLSLAGVAEKKLSLSCLDHFKNAGDVTISSCSSFEIALKHKRGQLDLAPFTTAKEFWDACIDSYGLTEEPVNALLFQDSVVLPDHHADPFDRIIIATAQALDCPIITYDVLFEKYDVQTMS